jgi:hypothetical protein
MPAGGFGSGGGGGNGRFWSGGAAGQVEGYEVGEAAVHLLVVVEVEVLARGFLAGVLVAGGVAEVVPRCR